MRINKVTLIWNVPLCIVDTTISYEPYVEGLMANGVEVLTVCPLGTESRYPYSTQVFTDESEITSPDYWRSLKSDAFAFITFHRMTNVLDAIRDTGLPVLNIGESDGQVSPRLHPWATLRNAVCHQYTLKRKLGAAKYWAQRYLFESSARHQAMVSNAAASDILTLAGEGTVTMFRGFLEYAGAGDLTSRVAWLPYPVSDCFCNEPVVVDRPDRVIAVGRWDSLQKNANLLAAAVRRLIASGRKTEFLIVGRGAKERFSDLERRFNPQVRLLEVQPREQIAELMASCRSILITSRWESGPIVANEMLAMGGTVVGTPIPSLAGITADGRFGRVSSSHSASRLTLALTDELESWDRGERDPVGISSHWRQLVSPCAVGGRMLELIGCTESLVKSNLIHL